MALTHQASFAVRMRILRLQSPRGRRHPISVDRTTRAQRRLHLHAMHEVDSVWTTAGFARDPGAETQSLRFDPSRHCLVDTSFREAEHPLRYREFGVCLASGCMESITSPQSDRLVSPLWVRWLCALGAVLSGVAAWRIHAADNWTLLALSSLGIFALAILGLSDALTTRIELSASGVVVVRNLLSRRYCREDIAGVTWAKGTPAFLQLVNGTSVELPTVGNSTQSVANSLRAWLKTAPRAA